MTEKSQNSPEATAHNTPIHSNRKATPPTLESLGFFELNEGLYNEELEKTTLSAMMVDAWGLATGIESLSIEMFYFDTSKVLFGTLLFFFTEQKPIDLLALQAFLTEKNWLDRVGGPMHLHEIYGIAASGRNIKSYIEPLKKLAAMRLLRQTGLRLVENTRSPADPDTLIEDTQQCIRTLYDQQERTTLELGSYLDEYNQDLVDRAKENKPLQGLSTGFEKLDKISGGLKRGELLLLAARPSQGKTAMALTLALNVAQEEDCGVLIFSMEMSKNQVIDRIKSGYHDIDLEKIQNPGSLEADEAELVFNDRETLGKLKLHINDQSDLTCEKMQAIITQHQSAYDIGLVIVDYAQLIQGSKGQNRYELMTNVSNGLKRLARTTMLPVIALSQLSREVEKRPDKRPQLSDLRESGSFEQDADVAMFLYRPGFYGLTNKETGAAYGDEAELIVAKNRNGQTGVVDLDWKGSTTRFTSVYNDFIRNIRAEQSANFTPPAIIPPTQEAAPSLRDEGDDDVF